MQSLKSPSNTSLLNLYRVKNQTNKSLLGILVLLVVGLVLIPIFYLVTRASQKSIWVFSQCNNAVAPLALSFKLSDLGIPERDQCDLSSHEDAGNANEKEDYADVAQNLNIHRRKGNFFTLR